MRAGEVVKVGGGGRERAEGAGTWVAYQVSDRAFLVFEELSAAGLFVFVGELFTNGAEVFDFVDTVSCCLRMERDLYNS